jgi:hypothetical protein
MFYVVYRLILLVLLLLMATTIVEKEFLGDEDHQDQVAKQDNHDGFLMA